MISLDASVKKLTSDSATRFLPGRQRACVAGGGGVKSFIVETNTGRWLAAEKRTADIFARLERALPALRASDENTLARQIAIASVPSPTGGEVDAGDACCARCCRERAGDTSGKMEPGT